MADSSRSDMAHAHDDAAAVDRDAKIEQLLLTGLDHYFAAQYQQAINVWTRALFLDRSHARARAYIERARSAMAERQRQSEEMLQHGVDAFRRGEGGEARRLLNAAIDGGAPSEEALAVLGRLDRLAPAAAAPPPPKTERPRPAAADLHDTSGIGAGGRVLTFLLVVAALSVGGYAALSSAGIDWRGLMPWTVVEAPSHTGAAVARETVLPLPRRGEAALARARALAASGHLHDALAALDEIQSTDSHRDDADRLRGDIQRQLLAVTNLP